MIVPSLLNRSNYSFLQSTLTIEEIVGHAAEHNFTHVVISDLGSAHSWPKFYEEAVAKNLIPVFALQINHEKSDLLVLAKNKLGFRELLKLTRDKNWEGICFDHLILIHLGGQDSFPDVDKYFANEGGDRGVYVRENKFLVEEDFEFYCALRAIDTNTSIEVQREWNEHLRGDYLLAEIDGLPEDSSQIQNIYAILKQCALYDILEKDNTLCFFENPEKKLEDMAYAAFEARQWKNSDEKRLYKLRLDEELRVIIDKKFCEYFLVVQDAVKWARENDVYVGPGRGSVCGSLLAYILDITEIDPMSYDLYFERFLNTTRSTIPDIDIDVANNRRDDLFRYLKDRYGESNVALISVYRTFKIKNSLRDLGRVYGIPSQLVDSYLKSIKTLDEELNFSHEGLKGLVKEYPHVIPILKRIQNYPCNLSVHAAGVIISSKPLSNIIPLMPTPHSPLLSSQWTADELKQMGLVKFDFLALQYLQSLSNIEKRIEQKTGKPIIWKGIDLNDPRVYETINKGHNLFIFQFENSKVRRLIQRFSPSTLLDLALISSIHRPGASDQITILLARKTSNEDSMSKTPQHAGFREVSTSTVGPLMSILNDTYGLLIYQEQLMKIVSTATSCSFGESDTFRRGMGNSPESTVKARDWFFQKSKNRFSQKELELLWELIFKFAKYGFNKSHAVAYALISYRLIWLKTYYPEIFYSEFLSTNLNIDCFYELEESGFIISPPTYGKSDYKLFTAVDKRFYFPVSTIIGLNLTHEQFSSIPFQATTAIGAIVELVNSKIPANTIKNLIRVGFFNELLSGNESELFLESNLENIIDNSILKEDGTPMYQFELRNVEITAENKEKYKAYQRELLGVDIHRLRIPLKLFEKYKTLSRISSLSSQTTTTAKYIGFITEGKIRVTFREEYFFLMKVSDGFYTSPTLALFGKSMEEMQNLKRLAEERVPVILDVEKSEEYYKVIGIRQIAKKK